MVLLPTIPYGTETNMHAFPLAMNLDPSTLNQVVTDLVESLVGSNIRKIVLLNSHGGERDETAAAGTLQQDRGPDFSL